MRLRLGNKDIPYNPEFRFMITTSMKNPNFPPEIFLKVRDHKAKLKSVEPVKGAMDK